MAAMARRILLACNSVPGYGGAGTASYDLFARLRGDGFDVRYLNVVTRKREALLRSLFGSTHHNPRGIEGVLYHRLSGAIREPHPDLARLVGEIDPELAVGVGHTAAHLLKDAAPERPMWLLTTGVEQVPDYFEREGDRDAVALLDRMARPGFAPSIFRPREARAVELADLIVTHSPMTRRFYGALFPDAAHKIHRETVWWTEWILDGADRFAAHRRPFGEREIDVLLVASRWDRTVKNYPLARKLARRLRDVRVHVVGEVPRRIRRAVHHGFVPEREAMFRLLGNARVVACPSRWDAAPGILFEAAGMGCNVVASRNCGNFELCHADLLAEDLDARAFEGAVRRGLAGPRTPRLDRFLETRSYEALTRLLEKA